jgi:signal transduction histidine kinase
MLDILLIGLVLVCLTPADVQAAAIELDPWIGFVDAQDRLKILQDPERIFTIEQVALSSFSSRFEEGVWLQLLLQEGSGVYWVRFTIRRADVKGEEEDWSLLIGQPSMTTMDLYHAADQGLESGERRFVRTSLTGDPELPARTRLFRLPLQGQSERTFFLRLEGRLNSNISIFFCTSQGRALRAVKIGARSGLFHGAIIVIAAFSLFFFIVLRDRSYLWQFLFLASAVFFLLVEHGFAKVHLPGLSNEVVTRFAFFWVGMTVVGFSFFSRSFLNTRRRIPRLDLMILVFSGLGFAISLMSFFAPIGLMGWLVVAGAVLVPFVALIPAGVCWRMGYMEARFYLAAWIVYSVTTPLSSTLFVHSQWSTFLYQTGVVACALLLTIALLDRMRLLRRKQEQLELTARETELQMMRADKMAALGQIIAGVAHEINNPNNFIFFNLPIMKRYLAEMEPLMASKLEAEPDLKVLNMPYEAFIADVYKLLGTMQHGSERITKIVAELKDYVHGGDEEKREPVKIEKIVGQVTALIGKQMIKMVKRFEVDMAPDLPPVLVNPGKLEQVMINLLINAGHAADKDDSRVELIVRAAADDEGFMEIRIEDNGAGIEQSVLEKIFDPFFTTKQRGVGTGLGLSISKKIVEDYGGTLTVHSRLGEGSCFTLSLPLAEQAQPAC